MPSETQTPAHRPGGGDGSEMPPRAVTLRAVGIACALMPVLAMWVVQAELIWYTGHSTAISLFFHVTFVVLLIALLNLWLERRFPRAALAPGEILTIYVMLSVAGTLCSHDLLQVMIPMLAYPAYAANPQNRWAEILLPHIRPWAIVTDPDAAHNLAVGNASIYNRAAWLAWARPLAFWSVLLLTLYAALAFLNVLFRQAWLEKERLSFPVIQIPHLIATRLRELLRNRLFWIAFGLTATIDLLNNVNFLYPNVPAIPIVDAFQFREYFAERPWNAIQSTTISLYPFVVGLTFFLPTDLAFSCWFFFVLYQLQLVLAAAIGLRELPGFPFPSEQAGGAYLALGLLAFWLARRHFGAVWRTIRGRPGGLDESREPVRYRTALAGLILCYLLLVGGGVALGCSLPAAAVFFLIFFAYAVAIARMRAELGPPAHDLHHMGPEFLIGNAVGTANLSGGTRGAFSLFYGFNRAYRAHFSAHNIEGYKLAQLSRLTARSLLGATAVAVLVGLASALWALLHALYVHGYAGRPAGQAFASEAWNQLEGWMTFPQRANAAATIATGIGAVLTLFLGLMRSRFTWWLWHPVGYATCSSWSMGRLWFCLFLGWLCKAVITRYGGAKAYRKALPFFVGLVLGEFVMGSLWGIFGAVRHMPVYKFWG